jgi:hypothetical protein
MKHVISEIVELSIRRNGGNLNEFIPSLSENDAPKLYVILNHVDHAPFLTPDLQTCPHSWGKDFFLEEHPYVAISFFYNENQYTKALIEPFPPEYPAHQVFRHVADALEMLDPNGDLYIHMGNDWEKSTMRNQVQLTARKAMAGVHSLTDDQTQALFDELLVAQLPRLTLGEALNVGTGNDPDLKRVVTDHIQFPQDTVCREDAKSILAHAEGKLSPATMGHVARAMGFLPREVELQKTPVPAEQKARIIRAAEKAQIPHAIISTMQQHF